MKKYITIILVLLISMAGTTGLQAQSKKGLSKKEARERRIQNRQYLFNLLSVSPRASFGIGFNHNRMTYQPPSFVASIQEVSNDLKGQYPWVPWKEVSVENGSPYRYREQRKRGEFFFTAGLNIPIFFLEVETTIGRFSEPFLTFDRLFPPWKLLKKNEIQDLLVDRVTTPDPKAAFTLRIGGETERLLPPHLQPYKKIGFWGFGLSASAYYLIGVDLSYRPGVELIDPEAIDHLEAAFKPIPVISKKVKRDAAEAIVKRLEASFPAYLWPPGMTGYGFSPKAVIDWGDRLRIAFQYHHERSRGMNLQSINWLMRGPKVKRDFFTISIQTNL